MAPAAPAEDVTEIMPPAAAIEANKPAMVTMKLLRHYVPRGPFEIVGYQRNAVTVKDAAGRMHELEPATFVKGEMMPPLHPGTGYPNKIWAGTVLRVPDEEARDMRAKGIAERDFD